MLSQQNQNEKKSGDLTGSQITAKFLEESDMEHPLDLNVYAIPVSALHQFQFPVFHNHAAMQI